MEQENLMKEYKKNSIKPGENLNLLLSSSKENINNNNQENNNFQSKKSNIIENYLNSQQNSNIKVPIFGVKRKFSEFNKKYEERKNNINFNNENDIEENLIKENKEVSEKNIHGIKLLDYQNNNINNFNEKTPDVKILEECDSSYLKKHMLTYSKNDKIILNSKNNFAIEFERNNKSDIQSFKPPFEIDNNSIFLKEKTIFMNNENENNNNFNVFYPKHNTLKNNNLLLDNINKEYSIKNDSKIEKENSLENSIKNQKEYNNESFIGKNNLNPNIKEMKSDLMDI